MNDAFGNPIVMGATYTTMIGGLQEQHTTLITGVATKVFKAKYGEKITLKITRNESLDYGGNGWTDKERHFNRSSVAEGTGTVSIYPRHLFPNPAKD